MPTIAVSNNFVLEKKIRVFVFICELGGDFLSSMRGEARGEGKPKPLTRKEREDKRKRKKLARLERQRSR